MRKSIFLIMLLMATICLSAEELTDKLTNGKLFYENEEYQEAYNILVSLEIKTADTMVIIGESCEKLGKYDEALTWYEAAKKAEPNNLRAGLSIVKIYMNSPLKNEKRGKQELERLYKETKDPVAKDTLKKLIKVTQKGENTKNKVDAQAQIELSYSDNINNGTTKKTVDNIEVPDEMKQKDDMILNTKIQAGYKIIDNDKLLIEPIVSTNYEMYFQNDDYSKLNIDFTLLSNIKQKFIKWSFPIGAGVKMTEGKIEENTYSVNFIPTIEVNKENSVSPHIGFLYRDNYKNDYNNSEVNIGIGGESKIGAGVGGCDVYFSSEKSSKSEMSNNRYGGGVNYRARIKEINELELRYSVESSTYLEGEKRKSITNIAGIGWEVKTKFVNIKTGYEFTISDNSENLYDYLKNKISLGINKGF